MRRRFRLNVQLAVETLVLLLLTLGVLTYYSHKVLSEEAHRDANLMLDAKEQVAFILLAQKFLFQPYM